MAIISPFPQNNILVGMTMVGIFPSKSVARNLWNNNTVATESCSYVVSFARIFNFSSMPP